MHETRPRQDEDPSEFIPEYFVTVLLKYRNRAGQPVKYPPKVYLVSGDTVLPSDVLLVSFDMTHGKDNEICIIGKKDGKMITIVNAFEGQEAVDIFKLLTTVKKKTEVQKKE